MTERTKNESQQMLIKKLLEDEYSINDTKVYVSETSVSGKKESIVVEKGMTYKGVISLRHNSEGSFFGMIKSYNSILTIESQPFFLGDRSSSEYHIHFIVDSKDLEVGQVYQCWVGVIYLGGELNIPLSFMVTDKKYYDKPVMTESDQEYLVEPNQLSYGLHEKGYFRFEGKQNQEITLKIIGKDKGLIFEQDTYHFKGSGQVDFTLEVTQEDIKRGLIPINSHPEHPLKVTFQIQNETEKLIVEALIKITTLEEINHMGGLKNSDLINQTMDFLLNQFEEEMVKSIVFDYKSHKKEALQNILRLLEALINKDLTNVNLRLYYISVAIDLELYHIALEEINQIDRFIVFYDQNSPDISDILMCLIALLRQDRSVERLVSSWRVDEQGNWVKIILKNKIISNRFKEYDEYKMLYNMGVRHVFLMAEAFAYINNNAFIPSGEDVFYNKLITFGALRGAVSPRLLRKIENSVYYLTKIQGITSEAAVCLLKDNEQNKNLLLLLALCYIGEENLSRKACDTYQLCLDHEMKIKDLLAFYIRSCFNNKQLMDLNYFRYAFDIEVFEAPCQRFIWLNLIIFREQFPMLTNYYYRKYKTPPKFSSEDIIMPEDKDLAESFLEFLLENEEDTILPQLYENGLFSQWNSEDQLGIVLKIAKVDEVDAIHFATELMNQGIYNNKSLELVASNFRGNTNQMTFVMEKLLENDVYHLEFSEAFLVRCILTRQHTDLLERVFLNYHDDILDSDIKLLVLRHLSACVIIQDYEVVDSILEKFVEAMSDYDDIAIEIAVLKICSGIQSYIETYRTIIKTLLEKHIHMGVIFPFYGELIRNKEMGHNFRAQQYFTYYTKADQQVNFCYRLDEENHFTKIPMNHIVFGLFLVKVVMFYGEYIQYYIEEVNPIEQDIRLSDIFVKEQVIEIHDEDNIFDLINTIEISKAFNDEESLEKAIENYLNIGDNKSEKVFLL